MPCRPGRPHDSDGAAARAPQPAPPKVKRPSPRILAGLLAGVAVGLFFGEGAAVLQPLADLYIRGMQMTVLPYLVLTLVGGLGQLDASHARGGWVCGLPRCWACCSCWPAR